MYGIRITRRPDCLACKPRFSVDARLNLGPKHRKVRFDSVLQLARPVYAVS